MQLRPMTMQDADFLLELKNYEETRAYSIVSKNVIKREDHIKYLEDNMQYFQIMFYKERLGAIRIKDNEVSIWVKREFRKGGIASYFLNKVAKDGMTAKIVEGNISSMRCFINAVFKPIHYINNYYIFQK